MSNQTKIIKNLSKNRKPNKTYNMLKEETLITQYNIVKSFKLHDQEAFFEFWEIMGRDRKMLLVKILREIYNYSEIQGIVNPETIEAQDGNFPGVQRCLREFKLLEDKD